jgi:REP element-mobilizing transposase RayT
MPTQSPERQRAGIATYLITFSCYGTHLHGQEGTVDQQHNISGTPRLSADEAWLARNERRMKYPPYALDESRRSLVLRGIKGACERRNWALIAAHVRTNHVHVIVRSEGSPESVMEGLKAYASRELNAIEPRRTRWAYHGSTRYLWTPEQVSNAIRYVMVNQGEPMEVYFCPAST